MAVLLLSGAVILDELMHATTRKNKVDLAAHKSSFWHNNPASLRNFLKSLKGTFRIFRSGIQSIIIRVEPIQNMDGNLYPFRECLIFSNRAGHELNQMNDDAFGKPFPLRKAQSFVEDTQVAELQARMKPAECRCWG